MKTKKEIALEFLKMCAIGKSREAFDLYTGKEFRHHNVYFKGDANTLSIAMEKSAMENPDKVFEVQRALQDGELVAVHSRYRQNPDDSDMAIMHILRFDNDKIVELWDFGQPDNKEKVNENGMF